MNIAIFADIHGRILLAFKLCARWEHETGEKIDLILQAGDMGLYPAVEYLDKATMRHAEREPTELGFMHDFVEYRDATAAVLAQTTCNLVFVRGNHEAHAWLDDLERQESGPLFPVDAYQRLYCLKTGVPYAYMKGNERLAVLGIGRIGQHSPQLKDTHIQPDEQARLKKLGAMPTDVLLTHDMPTGFSRRSMGMPEITTALEKYRPAYHFYGHIGGEYQQGTSENGTTHYCKLADLDWRGTERVVHPGSMAILRWHDQTTHSFSIVRAPWYQEYTANTWLRL
ncbi:metallophosphoesterase [Ktedonobacteria bacterium brp13]|nr:metallophosphoesterase [Ktedonobacteria bacterium brp13]